MDHTLTNFNTIVEYMAERLAKKFHNIYGLVSKSVGTDHIYLMIDNKVVYIYYDCLEFHFEDGMITISFKGITKEDILIMFSPQMIKTFWQINALKVGCSGDIVKLHN